MLVDIDIKSGFCFGVVHAIEAAEAELEQSGELLCLGDIVHNSMEVERLKSKGLRIIDHEKFKTLRNCKILIRAHGEPPETYMIAKENNIELIDASCPIVLTLQGKIRKGYDEIKSKGGQIVIYGKDGHAEVVGLKGHSGNKAIIINNSSDIEQIDFSKPVRFYAQTTQNPAKFQELSNEIEHRMKSALEKNNKIDFKAFDSICRRVSNRAPELEAFVVDYDVVIFASDSKSSNGKYLFEICKAANPKTYFAGSIEELQPEWTKDAARVGVCGATSTPRWVMEGIRDRILSGI